jgi:hypothetical protein
VKKALPNASVVMAPVRANIEPAEDPDVKVTLVMRCRKFSFPITNVLVTAKSAARDIVNIGWEMVDYRKVTHPNIMSFPREYTEM